MELLDLLEARINELVVRVDAVRTENARLTAQAAQCVIDIRSVQDENQALRDALLREQQIKDAVLERIDTLLERLKDVDSDA